MLPTRPVNPDQKDINDLISLSGGFIAHRYNILCTPFVGYRVWEPSQMMGAHSTITTIEGKWYGNITSRPLPASLDALPAYSKARSTAVQAYYKDLHEWEDRLIRATFPLDFAESTEEEKGGAE